MHPKDPQRLAERVLAGDLRAGARAMRLVEDAPRQARPLLRALYPHTGRARVVGLTGNPGSGKSTLGSALVRTWRRQGRRVGVIAVDPSSPFTGGAILGDRIRMGEHSGDDGVFIRSLATRGQLGGLSRAAHDVATVLEAMGFDTILVETVGVGQDEVDVVRLAQTVVVVLVPGLGDDIQAIKAGILEIADVFAVNKADRPNADRTVADLRQLQALLPERPAWLPPIVKTVAPRGEGVDELVETIERHRRHLEGSGALTTRLQAREEHVLRAVLDEHWHAAVDAWMRREGRGARLLDALTRREADPYSAAESIAASLIVAR